MNNNNFWFYSTLQNKDIKKTIFRNLQDTACVCHVGVPLWGTDMAAIDKVSRRNETLLKSTFLVYIHSYGDNILLNVSLILENLKVTQKNIGFMTF